MWQRILYPTVSHLFFLKVSPIWYKSPTNWHLDYLSYSTQKMIRYKQAPLSFEIFVKSTITIWKAKPVAVAEKSIPKVDPETWQLKWWVRQMSQWEIRGWREWKLGLKFFSSKKSHDDEILFSRCLHLDCLTSADTTMISGSISLFGRKGLWEAKSLPCTKRFADLKWAASFVRHSGEGPATISGASENLSKSRCFGLFRIAKRLLGEFHISM